MGFRVVRSHDHEKWSHGNHGCEVRTRGNQGSREFRVTGIQGHEQRVAEEQVSGEKDSQNQSHEVRTQEGVQVVRKGVTGSKV
jgi:hypothetical protein